jgi:hypothetical protein
MIQPGEDSGASRLPPTDLLISSLSAWTNVVLLNVSLGDQGELSERSCGCPLGEAGWKLHLHTIRSYEKLTAGGMTFLDAQVISVLEQVLPARFGGDPTQYQLVDEGASDGQPRLRLLVHPALGPLDAGKVTDAFLSALGAASGAERIMSQVWREGGFLTVVREAPRATPAGKILHIHVISGNG